MIINLEIMCYVIIHVQVHKYVEKIINRNCGLFLVPQAAKGNTI